MLSILPPPLTGRERKALNAEIKKQCVELTKQYEVEFDAAVLYTLNKVLGLGKKRLQMFYKEMFAIRREMQERYSSGDDDKGIGDFAMIQKLKEKGIDVQQMYNQQEESARFEIELI